MINKKKTILLSVELYETQEGVKHLFVLPASH